MDIGLTMGSPSNGARRPHRRDSPPTRMLLKRFYDDTLAQASYLIGCAATGQAIVVDPNRDVEMYVRAAADEHLTVTHVTETHIHADFVSGARELASRTGAQLLLSDEGGDDWRYRFAVEDGATLLHDGDSFRVGNVRFDVMHTPGHTPEHIVFIVTDTAAADRPMGMLSGDFVFVGDVGRPDLLERAAHVAGTMERSARQLYASLQRLAALPDYLQIWPGHGAGSACGKSLGAVPSSTLGYERLVNWAFGARDEEEFVASVLAGQPEPPMYFAEMKRINRDGPSLRAERRALRRVTVDAVREAIGGGAWVVDIRAASTFAEGFVPGTVNIPLKKSFTTWAGSLIPFDREIVLLTGDDDAGSAEQAARLLTLIGLDRVIGWAGADVLAAWPSRYAPLGRIPQVESSDLPINDGVVIVDVRAGSEWAGGHIPGAVHRFLGTLPETAGTLPHDRSIVLQCAGGSRSMIAASLLAARGFTNVSNLAGGFDAWRAAGRPVERDG